MKLKQFSKKTVSLILAVSMMITAVFVGTFTTTAVDGAPTDDTVVETQAASDYGEQVADSGDTGVAQAVSDDGEQVAEVDVPVYDSSVNYEAVGVGANNGIIPAGDYLYYDFSAARPGRVNYCGDNWNWVDTDKIPSDYIFSIKLTADLDFHHPGNGTLCQCDTGNWEHLSPTIPGNGQNCVKVAADGKSYTWTTYNGSSGGDTENWYLSGYLNKSDIKLADSGYIFKKSSTNVYTCTIKFTNDQDKCQYVTINNGTNVYSPSKESGSGTKGDVVGTNPNVDPKWKVPAKTNDIVTFTWNSSTHILKWEVSESNTYTVTINNGIKYSTAVGSDDDTQINIASSHIDASGNPATVDKNKSDLSVKFTTELSTNSRLYNSSSKVYNYKVFGYSVLITTSSGKKIVDSVRNVSSTKTGSFTATYSNIPKDVESVEITPVYVASDAYAKAMGMDFTTVYLKYAPGDSSLFDGTYEPTYYVWRYDAANSYTASDCSVTIKNRAGQSITVSHKPVGKYSGQKMLYVGNDTYMAIVEDYLSGITFSGGSKQTFDFDEFTKLQKLGYNNITFEPKKATNKNISQALSDKFSSLGNVTSYSSGSYSYSTLSDTNINSEFELYTNLEGNYIDVFGNPLTDKNGKYINEKDVSGNNTTAKLTNLLTKLSGNPTPLYGARYGDGKGANDTSSNYTAKPTYAMEYPIRVYYFNRVIGSTAVNMVAQMVSGYGTIEYNNLANSSTTNASRYLNYNGTNKNCTNDGVIGIDWYYYTGLPRNTQTSRQFTASYSIIPQTYAGSPYLVAYMPVVDDKRIDGRWYYSRVTPEFDVNVKVGTGTGTSFKEDSNVGTAKVNGVEGSAKVKMSTTANITATAKNGYKFVGYYDSKGNELGTNASYAPLITDDLTVYAVFEQVENTLTVRNDIFTDKKDYTLGSGIAGVKVEVWNSGTSTSSQPTETAGGESAKEASVTIHDNDKYRITLYGAPIGDDTFNRFLSAPLDGNGETDYTVLADVQYDDNDNWLDKVANGDNNPAYTYTFDIVKWNSDAYGSDSISLQYYTDFLKASYMATLTYIYTDRFGEEKTYVVQDVELDEGEIKGTTSLNGVKYCPSEKKVLDNAPQIDDLYKDCTWTCTGSEANVEAKTSQVTITGVQHDKKVRTYIKSLDKAEKSSDGKTKLIYHDTGNVNLYYNDLIELSTPASYTDPVTGEKVEFSFWKEYAVDVEGNPVDNEGNKISIDDYHEGQGAIFSMESTVGIRVSADKMYKAWYGINTEGRDFSVDMREASYTREKYTDDLGNEFDFVYSDFALQFTAFNQYDDENYVKVPLNELLKRAEENGPDGFNGYNNINIGVVAVMTDDNYDGKTPPEIATNIDQKLLEEIVFKNDQNNYNEEGQRVPANDGEFVVDSYEYNSQNYNYIMRNLNDIVDELTILGRYDYYLKFTNNEYYRSKIFNVYAYISYREFENGEWGARKYVFSDPEVLSIFAAGTDANTNQG